MFLDIERRRLVAEALDIAAAQFERLAWDGIPYELRGLAADTIVVRAQRLLKHRDAFAALSREVMP